MKTPVGQISTKLPEVAFQRAIFRTVDVVMRAIDAQIGAVGIIFVLTHTTVAQAITAVSFRREMNGPRSQLRWVRLVKR